MRENGIILTGDCIVNISFVMWVLVEVNYPWFFYPCHFIGPSSTFCTKCFTVDCTSAEITAGEKKLPDSLELAQKGIESSMKRSYDPVLSFENLTEREIPKDREFSGVVDFMLISSFYRREGFLLCTLPALLEGRLPEKNPSECLNRFMEDGGNSCLLPSGAAIRSMLRLLLFTSSKSM